MDIFYEEIFGFVVVIYVFDIEEEVIQLVNDIKYGFVFYFYGCDYVLIWRVVEVFEYGMVGINIGMIFIIVVFFGGIKQSGFGCEGFKYGLDDYFNIKYMCWGGVE